MSLPPGFKRCDICGEFKGTTLAKYLNWSDSVIRPNAEKEISVLCLCNGIACKRCKVNKVHRPISNSYDPETNRIWHWAYFMALSPCDECRMREQAQWN